MKNILPAFIVSVLVATGAWGESFEAPEYQPGQSIDGIEGWQAGGSSHEDATSSAPKITGEESAEGNQSLKIGPGEWVRKESEKTGVRFIDFHVLPIFEEQAQPTLDIAGARLDFARGDSGGQIVVFPGDVSEGQSVAGIQFGLLEGSNLPESWMRITVRMDWGKRRWDLFLNGKPMLANLPLHEKSSTFTASAPAAGDIYLDAYGGRRGQAWFIDIFLARR